MLPQFVWLCGWDTDGSITLWKSLILGMENILSMVFRTTALTHVTAACYVCCVEYTVFMMMHYSILSLVININAHS